MAKKLTAYQAHMKRELKGKMKGKTAAQRKAIFKRAASSYKKSPTKSGASKSRKKSSGSRTKSKVRKVGKNGFNTQKIMKYVRLAALAAPAAITAINPNQTPESKVKEIMHKYTGFNMNTGKFDAAALMQGWAPFAAATVVTYGIPKLAGIIRGL